jgi:hypothetical protein
MHAFVFWERGWMEGGDFSKDWLQSKRSSLNGPYLYSVGKRGAHAVAGRHGLGQGLRALELRINDLQTADTRLHYHACRESLQTLNFIIKITVGGEIDKILWLWAGQTLAFFCTHHPMSFKVAIMMLSTSSMAARGSEVAVSAQLRSRRQLITTPTFESRGAKLWSHDQSRRSLRMLKVDRNTCKSLFHQPRKHEGYLGWVWA